jgi:hypothetical protein
LSLAISHAQRVELRAIALDAPPAIRRRLLALLVEIGRGQARTLDSFLAPLDAGVPA